MSSMASLLERVHKFKQQRQQQRNETDQGQDSNGNRTDYGTWLKKIDQQGNKAEDWLLFINSLTQNVQGDCEGREYDEICNIYSKAIKAISSSGGHKSEAYAKLFVKYATFVSHKDADDARDLFYTARINLGSSAIVHIHAAQFELQQGNIERCRKIFDNAKEIGAGPSALLEAAHLNFLLGYEQFMPEAFDQTDGKVTSLDTSRDSGISMTSGRIATTGNPKNTISQRTNSRGGSSSDDSLPLSSSVSDQAFVKPPVPKASGSSNKMLSLIKPPPAKRDLMSVHTESDAHTSPLPTTAVGRSRMSLWNNAFLPDVSSYACGEEQGTISFNFPDGKKPQAASDRLCEEQDTLPLDFDSNTSQFHRPLRSSHSTPDCKTASALSLLSSRKKRFTGKARRVLPQVKEDSNMETRQGDAHSLPIMPDLDTFGTEGNASASTTLTHSSFQSGPDTLMETSIENTSSSQKAMCKPETPTPEAKRLTSDTRMEPPQEAVHPIHHPPSSKTQPSVKAAETSVMPVDSQCVPEIMQTDPPSAAAAGEAPDRLPSCESTPNAKQEVLIINRKPYSVLNCIGQGGTSSVFEAFDADHSIRAVKMVNMAGADKPTINSYRNEIELLQRLQFSDRVVKMYDYEFSLRANMLYVVMERGSTDLATFFSRDKKLNDIKIMYFWQEMLEAVQVLHQQGIVHTDLKPANFMLVAGHLKLIDFGIAKAIQQDKTSVTTDQQVGTLNFMSPEALMADSCNSEEGSEVQWKHKIGYKSDVWSLGCILYRMVYGRTPFQAIRNPLQKMRAIINPHHKINFPPISDANLYDTIQNCLIRDVATRPKIEDLLNHPYLQKTQEPASNPTHDAMLKLMQQVASASPTSFSAVKQNVQGLLAQLQISTMAPVQATGVSTAPAKTDLGKAGTTARSAARAPLSEINRANYMD